MDFVGDAHLAGSDLTGSRDRDVQRALGQFMTPPAIARCMARRLVDGIAAEHVRLLEPSAGSGVLVAAVVTALIERAAARPQSIEALMFEIDPDLVEASKALCERLGAACRAAGVEFRWRVEGSDFLRSDLAVEGRAVDGLLVIANPPFLKLNKATDPRAALHRYAVHGQPNLYGLFMAACARLVGPGGRWCFITPRSWMAGPYFRAVRHAIHVSVVLTDIHVFESRRDSFADDEVLQETVIAWGRGRDAPATTAATALDAIHVSTSAGARDLDRANLRAVPRADIVKRNGELVLHRPGSAASALTRWDARLDSLGLAVSTGPVVAFRARALLRDRAGVGTVPLLWLQHVRQQQWAWPIGKSAEHIDAIGTARWLLVDNAPMVILRRFSPKEDLRRVTCVAYEGQLPGAVIGLENHLNYIHRPGGRMSVAEARGLAAYLASAVVDDWFRALAGSTQINASELRQLPVPSTPWLEALGRSMPTNPALRVVDDAVEAALARADRLPEAA
jgi:adenine-specific DNA-methyltransferase